MARIEVPMPQMGESIAEGTVSKWLKQVGDDVGRDEPLLEISTDKVDAEIPSPAAGHGRRDHREGGRHRGGRNGRRRDRDGEGCRGSGSRRRLRQRRPQPRKTAAMPQGAAGAASSEAGAATARRRAPSTGRRRAGTERAEESAEDRLRRKSTPLVRRIAAEHGIDIAESRARATPAA
jgi:pyruvate dehydrogenase E2 component (dihydrolipoamide acetyltransferase)